MRTPLRTQHLIAMLSAFLALMPLQEHVHADQTLQIPLYKHQGCAPVGESKILPLYAHIGGELTFRNFGDLHDAWNEHHKCNLAVIQKQKDCELASQPSENLPPGWRHTCADHYRVEIATCRRYYEREKPKCDLLIPKTERKASVRDEIENVSTRKTKHDASTGSEWEELVPSDKSSPGWEELVPSDKSSPGWEERVSEESYDPEATSNPPNGVNKGKQKRRDLVNSLMSKHQDRGQAFERRVIRDRQRQNQQHFPLVQSSGDGNSRCYKVVEQVAANMRNASASHASGACAAGREQLRMLTYAKDNLSRHGCYSGEHDRNIAEARNYIGKVC